MSSLKSLRTLALAAALLGAAAAPSLAEGNAVPGPTAVGAWPSTGSRTPLAGRGAVQMTPQQRFLELSGATGGGGQHS